MFKQISTPDHVLALEFGAILNADDVRQVKAALDAKLSEHSRIGVLVDITGLDDMSADALAAGIHADLDALDNVHRYHRVALVADKQWPAAALGMLSPMLGGLDMKCFSSAQRDEALRWVGEGRAETGQARSRGAAPPSVRIIPTTKPDVMAFEIDGRLTGDAMAGVVEEIKGFLERNDKVRLIGHLKHMNSIDLRLITQSGFLSMKLAALKKVERYAVVGAPGWMKASLAILDPITSDIDLKAFSAEEEAEAWRWIGAERA